MTPQSLDDVLARIADGEPVDWSQALQLAPDAEARALIDELRAIERLHDSHRSVHDEAGPWLPPPRPAAPVQADAGDATQPWGKYRLLAKLGAGSFGTVFRGRDDDLHRDLAIKLLHDRGDGRHRPRLLREAQDLARIRHANVVSIYAVEEHAGQVGLCMELIEGRTLDAVLRQDGPLNAEEATAVGQSVGRGLAAIHQAGLLHRDVNAKNVMRERAGRYVLMDLGAGLDTSDASRVATAGIAGTPLYMAPEVLAGGAATVRSDIYSLGVLLYFLVSGRHPVEGRSREDITRAHSEGKRTFLTERRADLPEAFVRCVERALSREPLNRHGSAAELLAELGPSRERDAPAGVQPAGISSSARASEAIVGLIALSTLAGLLTTWTFDQSVGRVGFVSDPFLEQVLMGARSLALPAATFAVLALVAGACGTILNLATRLTSFGQGAARRLSHHWHAVTEAARTDTVEGRAKLMLFVSLFAAVALYYIFGDIWMAITADLNSDQPSQFVVLGPAARNRQLSFRLSVAAVVAVLLFGWNKTLSSGPSGATGRRLWPKLSGIATIAFFCVWLQAPYKMMSHNAVPVVQVDGARCYLVGQRIGEDLVYCPTAAPASRVYPVLSGKAVVVSCGIKENVFAADGAGACAGARTGASPSSSGPGGQAR